MRIRTHIILLFLTLCAFGLSAAPSPQDIYKTLAGMIKTANIDGMSDLFDTSVEITINEREGTYSRSQAEVVLKNFFSKAQPESFDLRHNGESGANDKYAIGILTTKDGERFRTFLSLKQKNGKYVLQELRFEKN